MKRRYDKLLILTEDTDDDEVASIDVKGEDVSGYYYDIRLAADWILDGRHAIVGRLVRQDDKYDNRFADYQTLFHYRNKAHQRDFEDVEELYYIWDQITSLAMASGLPEGTFKMRGDVGGEEDFWDYI